MNYSMTNTQTRACHVAFYKMFGCFIDCFVWLALLPLVIIRLSMIKKRKNIYMYAHARDTPTPPVFACNLDIFFGKLVTCTHYGATYWVIPIGYGVFPRRIYSDCTDRIASCQ